MPLPNTDVDTAEAKAFRELALDIFPPENWDDWEIRSICKMGLAVWFGLEDECEE